MKGRAGGQTGWNGNDAGAFLILTDDQRSDRQPMQLLKWANGTTETVSTQSSFDSIEFLMKCTREETEPGNPRRRGGIEKSTTAGYACLSGS